MQVLDRVEGKLLRTDNARPFLNHHKPVGFNNRMLDFLSHSAPAREKIA